MRGSPLPILSILLFAGSATAQWTSLAPGIEHGVFDVGGHRYNVVRIDKGEPTAIVDTAVALGEIRLFDGRWELVEDMASRYDDTIFYWDDSWGPTRDVVAAVNGFYFDTTTAEMYGGMVMGGWYAKRYEDWGGSGLYWRPLETGHSTFIGGCIHYRDEKNIVTYATGVTHSFDGINEPRTPDSLIIYTPQYSSSTHTDDGGVEVLVEIDRPLMIVNAPSGVQGTVVRIHESSGSTPIPFDHVVLSASGTAADTLRSNAAPGDGILISMELTHYEEGCSTPNPDSWLKPHASIGRDFVFLAGGTIDPHTSDAGATALRSRTAHAYNADHTFIIVEDEVSGSTGVNMQILGEFCRDELGATDAATQDGGGSSKMWLRDRGVVNSPSDPGRRVVNALLVVSLQPADLSTAFLPGDTLEVASPTPIRLGPGSNYGELRTASPPETCTVLAHQAAGAWATGAHHWKCSFSDVSGWLDESALVLSSRPDPSPDAAEPSPDTAESSPDASTDVSTDTAPDGVIPWAPEGDCGCRLVR